MPVRAAPGRPPVRYCLTAEGDHFFPKQYPELTIGLLDAIAGPILRGGREHGVDVSATRALVDRIVAPQ